MNAIVLRDRIINGEPVKAGDLVHIDNPIALSNLVRYGDLAEYDGAKTLQSADAADTSQPAEDGVSAVTKPRKRKPKTTN